MGYRITHPTYRISKVILLVREVSLIGYVSEVTGLKMDMLFPVTGSVCPEITNSRHSTQTNSITVSLLDIS